MVFNGISLSLAVLFCITFFGPSLRSMKVLLIILHPHGVTTGSMRK